MAIVSCIAMMSVSCKKDEAQKNGSGAIVGTWVISDYQWYSDGQLVPDEYDDSEDMDEFSVGTVYDFRDDGFVLIEEYYGVPLNWAYNADTKTLYIGYVGEDNAIPVTFITSTEMTWTYEYQTSTYFDFETNTIEYDYNGETHTSKEIYILTKQ